MLLQRLPALVVVCVQLLACLEAPFSGGHAQGALKHERLRSIGHTLRQQLLVRSHFEAIAIGTVWGHNAVQGRTSWLESVFLRLVFAKDQAHEFAHAVAWKGRRYYFRIKSVDVDK